MFILETLLNHYFFFKYAPTANVTKVSFRNGRATYTKLKD